MTLPEFFGCAFLAFGPALAMFLITVANDPLSVIVLIASSFFWLLSLLFSSIIWNIIPISGHLILGMVFSVAFQEVVRFGVYKLIRKTEYKMSRISDDEESEVIEGSHNHAYVVGLGFGIMSGLFALLNVLADSVGPATVGVLSGSSKFLVISAAFTSIFTILHTLWSVIFFSALDNKNYYHLSWVVLSHFAVSGVTFMNASEWYAASLSICIIILLLTIGIAYRVAGGTLTSFKNSILSINFAR